jgi:carboxyl-terminal processing protease
MSYPSTVPSSRPSHRGGKRFHFLTVALAFVLGIFSVTKGPELYAQISGRADFFDPISDVFRALSAGYVDKPDLQKLQKGAIDGMLEALDDPYAEYIPPEDSDEFEKAMTGHFSGIGCQIEMRDGWLTVVTPLEESPALTAGILSGDRIISIEDKSTFGLTSDQCVELLTGPPDTQVSFVVQRDGVEIPHTLTRKAITYRAVRGLRRLPGDAGHWDYFLDEARGIGYIRLAQFTPSAPDEFEAAIDAARAAAAESKHTLNALVLDLRGNPGGTLEAAHRISDAFLESGTIVSIKGRVTSDQTLQATPGGAAVGIPVAVLVDGGSASASEIVAGALQDHNAGVVIGTRTFGKGLVQTVIPLQRQPDAKLKFTTQKYYLPSGRLIQRQDDSATWGVDPNPGYYVPVEDGEILARFLRRRDFDAVRASSKEVDLTVPHQDWANPDWIAADAKDTQLAAALRALQSRLDTGEWKPVSDKQDAHAEIAVTELRTLERTRERLGLEFARIDKRIDALETAAATGQTKPELIDLWPDDTKLTDGRLEIRDADGNVVALLKITGEDIERWLLQADVQRETPAAEDQSKRTPTGG